VNGHGFHEEEILGKAFDLPLVKRLLRYVRPYWLIVIASILLVLLITAVTLALPLVWRECINSYIVTTYKLVDLSKARPETREQMLKEAGRRLLIIEGDRRLISDSSFSALSGKLKDRLNKEKEVVGYPCLVFRLEDYPESRRPDVRAILRAKPGIYRTGRGFYYVHYEKHWLNPDSISKEEKRALRAGDLRGIAEKALLYFGLLASICLLSLGQIHLTGLIGQRVIMDIRMKLFEHVETLSLRFFDSNPVGRLVTRVANDIEVLNQAFTNILINLFRDIFLLVGIVAMLLWLNVELALLTFALLPFLTWVTFYFRKKVREAFREVRARIARINATIAEHIAGMSVVQLFHREDAAFDNFKHQNTRNYEANLRQVFVFAVFRPVISIFESLAVALLIWYGGGQAIQGRLDLGGLVAFLFYMRRFFQPINELSQKYNQLQQAMASSERVFMLMDETDIILEPKEPRPLDDVKGEIEFKNVWFAYKEEEHVLKDVSFKVKPGEKVALVGPTGAGKSSIISLLSRFYDVRKGQILVDGVDVRDTLKDDLRSRIAVVMQDVFIFSGDIKSNIRLNTTRITDDAITSAARYAKADAFIQRLPGEYDHELHERGATLSQGERQLLSFARAVAFNPRIFVLDEATANIDTETEVLIQQAIDNLMQDRTSIVIAHRLSTVRNVDRILVLNHGRIVEEGSHQELLAKQGLYYKLYQLQYKDQAPVN
jgi:ATP-binding cassette subfamily B protein/subfamily B ATP-binding cassette protein MsbA